MKRLRVSLGNMNEFRAEVVDDGRPEPSKELLHKLAVAMAAGDTAAIEEIRAEIFGEDEPTQQ